MIDLLGEMWLPALLVFLATTAITLGLIVHRLPTEQPSDVEQEQADEREQAEDPDDGTSD